LLWIREANAFFFLKLKNLEKSVKRVLTALEKYGNIQVRCFATIKGENKMLAVFLSDVPT
jgi:hypothetical protein